MSRNINRRDVLKGAGAAGITAGLAGCIGGITGGGGRTLKQGVLLPLTGDLASLGKLIRDGATLPAKQLKDETDFTIDVKVEDSETSPSAGITAANSLVNAGYPAVTGPASSGVNLQVCKQVFIPKQTVGCSPSSTSPKVTTLKDDDYVWRTAPSDALQGQVIAQVGRERLGDKTAATMYVNNSYGQALSKSFADSFEQRGGTVQTQVAFEKEQPSYTSQLSKALGGNPDMLVVIGYPASGVTLFRDYYSEFKANEDVVVTDGLIAEDLPNKVGNPMKNVTGTAPKASGPGRKFFDNLYKEQYGQSPGVFNAHAYDATAVCLLANIYGGENSGQAVRDNMAKAANPEGKKFGPEKLKEAFEAAAAGDPVKYVGASSSVNFDDKGDMKAVSYAIYKFNSDGYKQVDTVAFGQ